MSPHDRILVVDDDPGMRRAIVRILVPAYTVEAVGGATEAMARLETSEFDLALVDVRLKEGDGYSLCHAIRARRPETDVILITGSISEPDEKLFRSLEEGAFYFLFKPFDRRVLLALVERCLRLQQERETKDRYAQALAEDLEKARLFQYSLLPSEPVAGDGWRIEGKLLSCDALGGDFYLAQAVEGGLVFSVSDVVGHGVSAAMYAGMLRSTLDAARRRGVDPAKVGKEVLLGIEFFEAAAFATMVYALLLPDGRLRYINAGHPPILWLKADGAIEPLGFHGTAAQPDLPRPDAAGGGGDARPRRPPPGLHRRHLRGPQPRRPGARLRAPGGSLPGSPESSPRRGRGGPDGSGAGLLRGAAGDG